MAKTEITRPAETSPARQRDIFSVMRDEMDRMFERFEYGWPRFPALTRQTAALTVPELDVARECQRHRRGGRAAGRR